MLQEDGNLNRAKDSSVSRVYEPQSSFLRSVKVRWGDSRRYIWKELPSWTMIGRWWELMVVRLHQSEARAMWKEAIVRSAEVESLREGK